MTLVFVFCICFVFFGYQCVRGVTTVSIRKWSLISEKPQHKIISYHPLKTSQRDPDRIKFLTIYMLVGAILCLLGSLSFSVEGIVTAVVYGITYFYFFFVLKSLMQKFNDEKARGISDEMISWIFSFLSFCELLSNKIKTFSLCDTQTWILNI